MLFKNLKKKLLILKKNVSGFSIMEMMIVLLLIGMIATISLSKLNNSLSRAKIKTAQIQSYELSRLIDIYKLQFGQYPSQDKGWNALVNPPDNISLLKKSPLDPWKNQYLYLFPGEKNPKSFDVISRGPDGKFSDNDIGNWEI